MTTKVPLIGFDRYVDIDWCQSAFDAAATESSIEVVRDQVATVLSGAESQRKTLNILKRLSTKPLDHLNDFVNRGVSLYKRQGALSVLPIAWGVSIATYSFFGRTAEITGRLLSLHSDCSIKEIQRRMAEQYGDRNGIERAVNRVLQSQVNWLALTKNESTRRIFKREAVSISNDQLAAWLIEAAILYSGKPISVASLQGLPVLFPFNLTPYITYALSNSKNINLSSEGPSNQFVSLREKI